MGWFWGARRYKTGGLRSSCARVADLDVQGVVLGSSIDGLGGVCPDGATGLDKLQGLPYRGSGFEGLKRELMRSLSSEPGARLEDSLWVAWFVVLTGNWL